MDNLTIEEMQLRDVVAIAQALKAITATETQAETRNRLQFCATTFQLMKWATRPKTGNVDRAAYRKALAVHWEAGQRIFKRYTS